MNKTNNYIPLHVHSHFSNIISPDVVVNEEQIAKRAKELGMSAIALTDHGSTMGKLNFQKACIKQKIKPIFGMEGYYVPDINEEITKNIVVRGKEKTSIGKNDRNGHILFLAKNKTGLEEINMLMSDSHEFGMYYKPRCDINMINKHISSENVIISTACIGSFVKKEGLQEISKFQRFIDAGNFYLEIQAHNNDLQKSYVKDLMNYHYQTKIPFIITTDTHAIDEKSSKLRTAFLHSKKIIYEEEEGLWHVDMPDINTLRLRLKEQGILTDEEIEIGLNNTNIISSQIEEYSLLEYSLKIPVLKSLTHLSQEERHRKLELFIYGKFEEYKKSTKIENEEEYLKGIEYELNEVKECKMADYFLLSYEVIKLGIEKYGGVLTKTSRGSASCYFINFLLGFTSMDRFKYPQLPLFPQRFMTSVRILESKTPPDKLMSSIIER